MGISDVEIIYMKMYLAENTYEICIFDQHMLDIKYDKHETYDWLIIRDVRRLTLSHNCEFRYGIMTTNKSK